MKFDDDFFKDEVRSGYLVTAKMKKVWAIELAMVEKIFSVCRKHNLKIWADGGTLLGAVRHGGFIPWDDDIDLAMLRPDYDKFIALPQSEFEPYFLQTAYTDDDYIYGHAQLRDSNTAAVLLGSKNRRFNQGIFVDVFVFDAVPDSDAEFRRQHRKVERARSLLICGFAAQLSSKNLLYSIKILVSRIIAPLIGRVRIFKYFENQFRKYSIDDNEYISHGAFNFFNIKKIKRSKHVYDETIYMDFESIKMPVPVAYDSLLTNQYGDYRTPVQAPTMHGGNIVFDTERPYTKVLEELRKKSK